MAIAFDNASSAVGVAVSSLQWTHTAAGANTYMVAGIALGSVIGSISAVIAGTVNLSEKLREVTILNSGFLYTAAGTPAGAVTMVATTVAAANFTIAIGVASYIGVSQASPDGGANGITAIASTNVNLAVSAAAGQTIFGIIGDGANDYQSPATQTNRFIVTAGASISVAGDEKPSQGNTTSMSWSCSVSTRHWAMGIGFSATATTSNVALRNLLGVGR